MTFEMIGQLIGGIGLFLLGMQLMTAGLKQAAGPNTPGRRRRASSSLTCAIGASDLLAPRLPGFPGIEPAVASSPAPVS